MTALVAGGLLALAILDGAFSGFRASVGRTGLIAHRAADRLAARRGVALALLALSPVIAGVSVDVAARPDRVAVYAPAGLAMLAIDGTYGVVVLGALACYLTMSWRKRYLASAVLLGPLTLARPAVALLGGAVGAVVGRDALTTAFVIAAVAAVLAVEPAAGRIWYRPATPRAPHFLLLSASGRSTAARRPNSRPSTRRRLQPRPGRGCRPPRSARPCGRRSRGRPGRW